MQPYLLPYVGYVHLMRSVDVFIWLDDAQFVKQRWMNRNRILLQVRALVDAYAERQEEAKEQK